MKLTTENGLQFFVRSMGKLHQVQQIIFGDYDAVKMRNCKGLIEVSHLPSFDDAALLAEQYAGDTKTKLKDFDSESTPYTSMYCRSFGNKFFQISAVFDNEEAANAHMMRFTDTAIIDSTDSAFSELSGGKTFHFIASQQTA